MVVNTTGTGLTLSNHEIDLSDGVLGGGLYVGGFQGVSGSKLNITGASIVDVGRFYVGYQDQVSASVIQSGNSTVKVLNHMRVGDSKRTRSSYQLSGGILDFTPVAVSPQFPYDSDYVTDDGGLWLGVAGAGTLHQTDGTLATNFLVLSYFPSTLDGDDPLREKDIYQFDGGTLFLKHGYGIISRRAHAVINLNGGTIRAAAGVSPGLDTDAITVQSGGVTLDTNGPNTFTLYGSLRGTGTVNLVGGGTLKLIDSDKKVMGGSLGSVSIQMAPGSTLHVDRDRELEYGLIDVWTGAFSGAGNFIKEKTGHLVLAGNASSFSGSTTVLGGRLKVPTNYGSPNIAVSDAASFGGEPTTTKLKLGETTGAGLYFDPQTPAALSVSELIIRGNSTFDFDTIPTSPGPWTVLNYVSRDLAGTFNLADAGEYRPGSVQVIDTGSSITVNLTGQKSLTWTGAAYNSWHSFGDAINWTDGATPQSFHHGDTVVFRDGAPNTPTFINVNRVKPWKTIINADQMEFHLSANSGGISGPGSVEKLGAATATFSGENTYSGPTILSGGVLSLFLSDPSSIGDGSPTNGVVFNGGTLATESFMDLGAFRPVIVNAAGGTMTASDMFGAGGFTISGPLRGNGPLTFTSSALVGATHVIKGDVSGFRGALIVKAFGATSVGTTLRLTDGLAASDQTISVLPSVLASDGRTSALDLVDASGGSSSTVELRSSIIGGVTQGSTLMNSTGSATWNGPIKLFGNGQTQLNVAGRLVINGGIASGGDFSGKFVLRGTGNGVLNGPIVLPGASVEKLAGSTWQINSQNNQWGSTYLSEGILRLGAHQALPPAASFTIANNVYSTTLDLNGFDQKVTGLTFPRGEVTNSAATLATLTVHQDTDTVLEGLFSGYLGIVKTGSGNMTFKWANEFSGPLVINNGTVTADGFFSTALGATNVAGRTITVGQGATLALQLSNAFGSGLTNESTMPLLRLNQGTLRSTQYNALGPLELNGGTLVHSNSDVGSKQGYQFRGTITVGGSVPSVISSTTGRANHLSANSVFQVGDATSDAASDLAVSNPLHNQSSDFGSAAGGLTKTGPGTMELGAINTFTGITTVREGTLLVTGSLATRSLTTVELGGTLSGTGTVGPLKSTGGTISPGPGPGSLSVGNLELAGGSFFVQLFGRNPDQFDKLVVTGSAKITSDTALDISLGYAPSYGDSFLLLSNDGVDAIGGSALFTVGGVPRPSASPFVVPGLESGQYFELNYTGGDGNDVVLVTVPEAGSVALLLCGALTFCARRRR